VVGKEYSLTATEDLLIKPKGERHPTEMAQLFGVRLVIASETEEGARLHEKRIKALTGSDTITARRMREDPWSFAPSHKLILVTNHRPRVKGKDHAIWRRLRLVPFEQIFWNPDDEANESKTLPPELRQDRQLPEKLAVEAEGILAWMVRGCLDWKSSGLTTPERVLSATRDYRNTEDLVAQFIAERCVTGSKDYRVRASALYHAFKEWLKSIGEEDQSQRVFGENLSDQSGIEKTTSNGTWYLGITLRQNDDPE
jgi:putative DNA primase/helicase